MRLYYRYKTDDGVVHEVTTNLQVAINVEKENPGKAFWQLASGTLEEQLQIVYHAYCQSLKSGEAKLLFPDWKSNVTDFQLDGKLEDELPPLEEAELKARNITPLT